MARHFAPSADNDNVYDTRARRRPSRRHHRHTAVIVLVIVLVVLLAVGSAGLALFASVSSVSGNASSLSSSVNAMEVAMAMGDADSAQSDANDAAATAQSMHQETQGVLWDVASVLPVIGQDVRNVRGITEAADTLASGALVPLAQASGSFSLSTLLQDGSINVSAVQQLADALSTVTPATQQAAQTLDALQDGSLSEVNEQLDNVRSQVDSINSLASGLSKVGSNLSTLLGANGQTKNYLIMALNNAEIRPAGGFVGSVGVLSITDGAFTMGDFDTSYYWATSTVTLTPGQIALEGQYEPYIKADTYFGNSSIDPNFPGTAQIALEHYQASAPNPVTLDGIVGVDPVFLQALLGLTDGITASDGTRIDGTNAAQELLNGVYLRYPDDADQQDAYLSDVASKCFDAILGGLRSVSITDLTQVLSNGVDDHHLQIWFADDTLETNVAQALGADGALETDPASPQLGVYLNNAGGTKMDWYLSRDTTLGTATTNADGSQSYAATTTIGNHVTADEAASLPTYIAGDGAMIVPVSQGEFATIVYLYAPAGGTISDVQCDGVTFTETNVDGFDVWEGLVTVPVAGNVDISYTVNTSTEATADLTVRSTATAQDVAGW